MLAGDVEYNLLERVVFCVWVQIKSVEALGRCKQLLSLVGIVELNTVF